MDFSSARGVLKIVEPDSRALVHYIRGQQAAEMGAHSHVLARRQESVIRISARHDGAKHDRLVRFVLEVGVPKLVKLGAHFLELFLGGTDLSKQQSVREQYVLNR